MKNRQSNSMCLQLAAKLSDNQMNDIRSRRTATSRRYTTCDCWPLPAIIRDVNKTEPKANEPNYNHHFWKNQTELEHFLQTWQVSEPNLT